jgi:hypothetical protein
MSAATPETAATDIPSTATTVPPASTQGSDPTATIIERSPSPAPATPTSASTIRGTPTESLVDRLAAAGYYPFEKDEISLMINPNLVQVESGSQSHDTVAYRFTGEHNRVLDLEISIRKEVTAANLISDEAAKSQLDSFTKSTSPSINSYTVVGSDATSINNQPGRALRYQFATNASEGYGVYMLIADGTWLYRFNVSGAAEEHDTVEEIVSSIFDSASLHH